MKILQAIAIRHPYILASVLFIAAMTFVKLGAEKIVTGYGLPGALLTIGAIYWIATLMERKA